MALSTQFPSHRRPETLDEAQAFIARTYGVMARTQRVPLRFAVNRILAEDIVAATDLPGFDAAAMDGFALRGEDLADGHTTMLRIIGTARAGHPFAGHMKAGEAVRIFTGAVVPSGADRVVMQEDCRVGGTAVAVTVPRAGKRHIRKRGEDVTAGDAVVAAGTRLGAGHVALLSGLRMTSLIMRRKLRVALISTGDELSAGTFAAGQIADANGPMLKAMIESMGCVIDGRGIVPDDPQLLLATLIDAAAANDLIVTSGGASVGDEDHLKSMIGRRGYLEFWKLRMKPGKPVGLGDIDDCPILALPGNPVAAAVAFRFLGSPLIARLSGDNASHPIAMTLPLARDITKSSDKLELLAANFATLSDGRTAVETQTIQGSANLRALAQAQGWIMFPGDRRQIAAGEHVSFVPEEGGIARFS